MTLTEFFLDELEREAARTKAAVAAVPPGHNDWKPHEKSMPLLRLAGLVATMPSWVALVLKTDELDVAPKEGGGSWPMPSHGELLAALDKAVADGRAALQSVDDGFLTTTSWTLKAGGAVMSDERRYVVLRELFTHLAHHRGQLTVYLRLLGAKVPAIYGPSADDQRFA